MSSIFAGFCCRLSYFTVWINIIEITLNAQTRVMMQLSLLQCFSLFFLEWKLKKAMWHFAAWMHAAVTLWFSWIGRLPQGFSKNYTLLTCHFSESIVFKWGKRATSTAHSLRAKAFSLSGGMTDWECWFCYRSEVKTNYWSIKDTQTEVPLWTLDM